MLKPNEIVNHSDGSLRTSVISFAGDRENKYEAEDYRT